MYVSKPFLALSVPRKKKEQIHTDRPIDRHPFLESEIWTDVPIFHGLLESEPVKDSVVKAASNSLLGQVIPIIDCVVGAACQSTLVPSALGVFLSQVLAWLPVDSTNARPVYHRVTALKVWKMRSHCSRL